jgi:CubicO group peptidase (beta-lactamase class C family)
LNNDTSMCSFMRKLLVAALLPLAATAQPLPPSLQAGLEKLASEHGVCAVAVATVKNRQPSGAGAANGCEGTQATSAQRSVFQAASLSKPVFAYAVLKLAEQGKLNLDTPVMNYLPQTESQGYLHVQNPFSSGKLFTDTVTAPELQTVTARMLLMHSSGLPNWSNHALSFSFEPGSRWRYSGEGYVLLQRAVEAIEGQPLHEVMQRLVLGPLGMASSSYVWEARFDNNLVPPMAPSGSPSRASVSNVRSFQKPVAAATLYTTATDYAKFVAAVLSDPNLLANTVSAPISVEPRLGLAWGLGWGIKKADDGNPSDSFIWQWGNNPGYRALVMASAQTGDGVVILTNSNMGMTLIEPFVQAVLPGTRDVFRFAMLK